MNWVCEVVGNMVIYSNASVGVKCAIPAWWANAWTWLMVICQYVFAVLWSSLWLSVLIATYLFVGWMVVKVLLMSVMSIFGKN